MQSSTSGARSTTRRTLCSTWRDPCPTADCSESEGPLHDELGALISAAGGRTLALFTSWRAMRAAAVALVDRLPFPILTQADLPKPALIEAFRDDEAMCLFATLSFWQGVDVPGRTLSLVAIDRIPFPRPGEPVLQTRGGSGPGAPLSAPSTFPGPGPCWPRVPAD